MDTFLIISVFLIAAAALALRRWNRKSPTETHSLPESQNVNHSFTEGYEGLFAEQRAEELKALAQAEAELQAQQAREQLIARASAGDETALNDAYEIGDQEVYGDALSALIAYANGNVEILHRLAKRIVDSGELPATCEFAEMMIGIYQDPLDRGSLADMLHLSALTGDTEFYSRTVETVMSKWREGRVSKTSAAEFLATIESGYWLISSEARLSGSGFLLKQAIAEVRRELAAAARPSSSISAK